MASQFNLTYNGVSTNDSWTDQASSTADAAILAAITDSSAANYITANTSTAAREIRLNLTAFSPRSRAISDLRVYTTAKSGNPTQVGTLQVYIVVSGTRYNGATRVRADSAESWVTFEDQWTLNPATSAPWTVFELDSLIIGFDQSFDSSWFWQISYGYVGVYFIPAVADLPRVRDVGSRALDRSRGRSRVTVTKSVPLSVALQAQPMQRIAVEHWLPRDSAGQAYGTTDWERGQYVIQSVAIRPDENRGELTLEQWRPRALLLWDGLATPRTPANIEDGVARIMRGNTRTFSRASRAHVEDPESGLFYEVDANQPKLLADDDGPWYAHEAAGTNYLLDSTNIRGVSAVAWAVTSVTNGAAAVWDGVTANVYVFNASTDVMDQTTGSLPQYVTLSIDHADSSAGVRWSAQRASDGQWYRASDQTWQATEQNNVSTPSADFSREQWTLNLGGATTLFFRLRGPTAGTSQVAHVQLEGGRYATTRIVTTSAATTRAADVLTYAWSTDTKLLWAAQGGFAITVKPWWAAADIPSGWRTLLYLEHDANNNFRIGYHASYGLTLEIEVGGVVYRAVKAWSPARNTVYYIAARWCSSRGEQGLAPYSLQVMLDEVLGTAVVASGNMTEDTSGDLEGFAAGGADHWDGCVRQLRIVQYVPTEVEMQRRLM